MLQINPEVKKRYPDCPFGIMMIRGVVNRESNQRFETVKRQLEETMQKNFSGLEKKQLRALAPFSQYHDFYKQFKKTYHVLHQCESIANSRKPFPEGPLLFQAMFMAEIKNQLLTAGYDCKNLQPPFVVSLSDGSTRFTGLGRQERIPPENDIIFSDSKSLLGSIICGPDHDHRIVESTSDVMFAIYGVPGISSNQIEHHFEAIKNYVVLFSPNAAVSNLEIL